MINFEANPDLEKNHTLLLNLLQRPEEGLD